MHRSAIVLSISLFLACSVFAQTPAAQQASSSQNTSPTIRVNAEAVTLDMVFHDKKGKPVHDIRPEEVHVYEDGTEEHLNSFRYVGGENAAPTSAPGTTAPATGSIPMDPMRELRFVTLVFEGLDQDGKRFFRQSLEDMLKIAPQQNLYFSVIVIDQKLNMIQSFTNDRAELMKSVDKSMMWTTPQYMKNSTDVETELQRTLAQGEPASQAGTAVGALNQSQIQGGVAWRMAKMQFDMLQEADAADREAGARGSLDALLALIRGESQLPGRKIVLYFNPWLFIPEIIKEQYNYMISAANRANITFYTVDPKGLVTWDQDSAGRGLLGGATGEIYQQQITGGVGDVSRSQARVDETAENGMRANPLLWLRDLAHQTGGVSITETNDLKAPLRTVMADVQSYYEASYDPHIKTFDGKFRHISVKVDRPGIEVTTRSGYIALPQLKSGQQLLAYEVPLMDALNAATPAGDVSFTAAAERFSERGPKIEYMLTLETPLKEITFAPQPDGKSAAIDVPLIALVRSASGDVVAKFNKEFAVQVPQASVDGYRQGSLVQTFHTELAPGAYTLETAVMDRKNNKIGVKKTPLTVPAPSGNLAISDVVIVLRTDALKNNQILDPFYFPGGKVVPTLNPALQGGAGKILPFYFVVYPDPAIKDAPKLTMAFYKGGQYLGTAGAALPAVQEDGRIPYIADLPADKFTPGTYEIRLGVTQGTASAQQKVDFKVQ